MALNSNPGLSSARWHATAIALSAAVASAAAAFVTALALLPPALVLPVTGAGLLAAAAAMAIIAWGSPSGVRLVFWDFAGLLTLFALGAALMGEPEQLALIERDRM
jgi:hypothetical protein